MDRHRLLVPGVGRGANAESSWRVGWSFSVQDRLESEGQSSPRRGEQQRLLATRFGVRAYVLWLRRIATL